VNRHLGLLAGSVLAMLACASNKTPTPGTPTPERVAVDQDFRLKWHQEVAVADTPYRLRFADVVEDSRCAPDVRCVWAGRVRIVLALALQGAAPAFDTLAFGPTPNAPGGTFRYGNLLVRFMGYEPPAARSTEARPSEKAVALLRVERSGE